MGTGSGTSLFDGGRAAWQMGTCKNSVVCYDSQYDSGQRSRVLHCA